MQHIIDEIKQWKAMEWLKAAIIIGLVVLIGLFLVNQYLLLRYNAITLSDPCGLCRSLNPQVEECFWNTIEIGNQPTYNITDIEEALSTYSSWQPSAPDNLP